MDDRFDSFKKMVLIGMAGINLLDPSRWDPSKINTIEGQMNQLKDAYEIEHTRAREQELRNITQRDDK